MTREIHCCREDDDLAKAVRHMEDLKIRRLPVINKSKRMVGILSLAMSATRRLLICCPNASRAFRPITEEPRDDFSGNVVRRGSDQAAANQAPVLRACTRVISKSRCCPERSACR